MEPLPGKMGAPIHLECRVGYATCRRTRISTGQESSAERKQAAYFPEIGFDTYLALFSSQLLV